MVAVGITRYLAGDEGGDEAHRDQRDHGVVEDALGLAALRPGGALGTVLAGVPVNLVVLLLAERSAAGLARGEDEVISTSPHHCTPLLL